MAYKSLAHCRAQIDGLCQQLLPPLSPFKKIDALPYAYYLIKPPPDAAEKIVGGINISVFGCQGNNGPGKEEVAKNIGKNSPNLMIGLGDTFYKSGVLDKQDPLFETHFHRYYSCGALESVPLISVFGNHDLDFQKSLQKSWSGTPYQRMMAQIEHSYAPPSIKKNWHMMSEYYVVVTEFANIYCLNSNFLAFDVAGQQKWLVDAYQKLNPADKPKKWNIVAMHHPLHSPGKRRLANPYDDIEQYTIDEYKASIYESQKQGIRCLNFALFNFFVLLKKQEINFELFLGAHDHLLAAMWQRGHLRESWQIISGAAGTTSELQGITIPVQDQHKEKPDTQGTGNDFYYDKKNGNGHVQLFIINGDQIIVEFHDIYDKPVCVKTFKRNEKGMVSCIDVES